jgi:hypothetical protein
MEHGDVVPYLYQIPNDMPPDESGSSYDDDPHRLPAAKSVDRDCRASSSCGHGIFAPVRFPAIPTLSTET